MKFRDFQSVFVGDAQVCVKISGYENGRYWSDFIYPLGKAPIHDTDLIDIDDYDDYDVVVISNNPYGYIEVIIEE